MSKIFSISEAASIAIHSLTFIAKAENMVSVSDIAMKTNFSKNHLAKVMHTLTKFGFVKSVRGPKGGFVLGKKPESISLLNIFEMIEGKLEITKCNHHHHKCCFGACIFGGLTEKFSSEFREYLHKTTIKDVTQ